MASNSYLHSDNDLSQQHRTTPRRKSSRRSSLFHPPPCGQNPNGNCSSCNHGHDHNYSNARGLNRKHENASHRRNQKNRHLEESTGKLEQVHEHRNGLEREHVHVHGHNSYTNIEFDHGHNHELRGLIQYEHENGNGHGLSHDDGHDRKQDHGHEHELGHNHEHVHKHEHGHDCQHGHDSEHEHNDSKHSHSGGCSHGGCGHDHSSVWAYLPHSHGLHERIRADARSLRLSCVILCCSLAVQIGSGLWVNSSVLYAEAVHTALDGLVLLVSLLSIALASRTPTARYTYGFGRAEVLSALVSVLALAVMVVQLATDAIGRLINWHDPTAAAAMNKGKFVIIAETITLVNNVLIAFVLARNNSLNVRALRAHVVADSVANIVVLTAGIIMWNKPQTAILDPILTLVVVVAITALNIPLARETVEVLMQAAPIGVDVAKLRLDINNVPGVANVQAAHVWTLTSGALMAALKVDAKPDITDCENLLRIQSQARQLCINAGITDSTIQVSIEDPSSPSNSDDENQGIVIDHQGRHRTKDHATYTLVGDDDAV